MKTGTEAWYIERDMAIPAVGGALDVEATANRCKGGGSHERPGAATLAGPLPPAADGRTAMKIWVDADACPKVIKEILYRAAERVQLPLILVANQALAVPRSPFISSRSVAQGLDAADQAIVDWAEPGDIAVTADIPLAARLVDKDVLAINPRGELYSRENVRQQLSMRDFMDELRGSGVQTGGPAAFHARDRQAFANQLDRLLARRTP
jgi:uncharacterized protein YaiI (UPF0178 family)